RVTQEEGEAQRGRRRAVLIAQRRGSKVESRRRSLRRAYRGAPERPASEGGPYNTRSGGGGEEAVAARRRAEETKEGAGDDVHAAKTGAGGDLLEGFIGAFELAAGGFDAGLQDVVGGSRADFAGKHALKVASAHGHALGEDIDGEFAIEVLSDPDLQFANR